MGGNLYDLFEQTAKAVMHMGTKCLTALCIQPYVHMSQKLIQQTATLSTIQLVQQLNQHHEAYSARSSASSIATRLVDGNVANAALNGFYMASCSSILSYQKTYIPTCSDG